MLDEIAFFFLGRAFARGHADHAFAAAPLRAKRAHGRALDEAAMRDADDLLPSFAMRSSMLISPSSGTNCVNRGEADACPECRAALS